MAVYRHLKCPLEVMECLVATPIGPMRIKSCQQGLHQVSQAEEIDDANFCPNAEVNVSVLSTIPDNAVDSCKPMNLCCQWLKSYFENPEMLVEFKPPLCLNDSSKAAYHQKVWVTLSDSVKFGETVSYAGLAQKTENPKAARAVGTAMMMNPFMLVVPCHRVIRSDGNIGLYAHGRRQKVKRWLLDHEHALPVA